MASLEDMYNSGGGENGLETYIIPPIKVRKGFRS